MSFSNSTATPTTATKSLLQPDHHPEPTAAIAAVKKRIGQDGKTLDPPNMQANSLRRLYAIGLPLALALAPIVFGRQR